MSLRCLLYHLELKIALFQLESWFESKLAGSVCDVREIDVNSSVRVYSSGIRQHVGVQTVTSSASKS